PHVEAAGRTRAHRDAEDGGEGDGRMNAARGEQQADDAREDHERHHPRLQEGEIVADIHNRGSRALPREDRALITGAVRSFNHVSIARSRPQNNPARHPSNWKLGRSRGQSRYLRSAAYLMRGSLSNWWNGGGEGSVPSSV